MPRITYYVVLPFYRTQGGELLAGEAKDALSSATAKAQAAGMIGKQIAIPSPCESHPPTLLTYVGAIAFYRTGGSDFLDLDDPVILAKYGETPEGIE